MPNYGISKMGLDLVPVWDPELHARNPKFELGCGGNWDIFYCKDGQGNWTSAIYADGTPYPGFPLSSYGVVIPGHSIPRPHYFIPPPYIFDEMKSRYEGYSDEDMYNYIFINRDDGGPRCPAGLVWDEGSLSCVPAGQEWNGSNPWGTTVCGGIYGPCPPAGTGSGTAGGPPATTQLPTNTNAPTSYGDYNWRDHFTPIPVDHINDVTPIMTLHQGPSTGLPPATYNGNNTQANDPIAQLGAFGNFFENKGLLIAAAVAAFFLLKGK